MPCAGEYAMYLVKLSSRVNDDPIFSAGRSARGVCIGLRKALASREDGASPTGVRVTEGSRETIRRIPELMVGENLKASLTRASPRCAYRSLSAA